MLRPILRRTNYWRLALYSYTYPLHFPFLQWSQPLGSYLLNLAFILYECVCEYVCVCGLKLLEQSVDRLKKRRLLGYYCLCLTAKNLSYTSEEILLRSMLFFLTSVFLCIGMIYKHICKRLFSEYNLIVLK